MNFSCEYDLLLTSSIDMSPVVKGSSFPSDVVATKCQNEYKSIAKKKIDMHATGDKKNNLMLQFLRCQAKATASCKHLEKEYSLCHKSFMGVGSYKGRRNCGAELEEFFRCFTS